MHCNPENDEHTEECIKSNSEHCIEIFPSTIQMLNNELASYTWARLTWEQRVAEHKTIHTNKGVNRHLTNYIVTPINALFRRPIRVVTLSQMQF